MMVAAVLSIIPVALFFSIVQKISGARIKCWFKLKDNNLSLFKKGDI